MKRDPSKFILNILLAFILAGSFFAFGFYWGERQGGEASSDTKKAFTDFIGLSDDEDLDMALFWKVYDIMEEKYIDEDLDKEELVYGAISGMVDSLGDPHSFFMDPEKAEDFEATLDSVYEGIGAYVGMRDDMITVISPLKNSPAEKAGVKAGDKILKIDDTSTDKITLDEAVSLLKGEKGTSVKLVLMRGKNQEVIEAEVVRDVVNVPSVEWEKEDDGIAYIRLNKFERDTTKELKNVIKEITADKENKKILLDLRYNPGGYFDEAIDIVGMFVGKEKVAVIEQKRNDKKTEYKTSTSSELKDWPIVILVNNSSASASEILAGALRDHRDVKLIGETTYGKGSVQEYNNHIGDGASLKLTIARWLTPKGTLIDGQGLKPDVEVENTEEDLKNDRDAQLEKAKEILKKM